MLLSLIKKYYKHILGIIVILGVIYGIWNNGNEYGYSVASIKYSKTLTEERNKAADEKQKIYDKLQEILFKTDLIVVESAKANALRRKEFSDIITSVKNVPTYSGGETCIISKEYVDKYNEAIKAANK
jgi:hypothetical protein